VEHKRPNSPNRANRGINRNIFGLPENQKYGLTFEKFVSDLVSCKGGKNNEPRNRTNAQQLLSPLYNREISPETQKQKKLILKNDETV
jgi:hypothetical protein